MTVSSNKTLSNLDDVGKRDRIDPKAGQTLTVHSTQETHLALDAKIPGERLLGLGLWLCILLLIGVMGPLFVCMPLWVDCTFFDIVARSVLRGERVYQQFFLHGPPGMILVTAGLRSLIGWRSEAIRVIDLTIVAMIFWLLSAGPWSPGVRTVARPAIILLMSAFYLSTTEWCHCQSDMWMLLPAVIGLRLRNRQIVRLIQGQNQVTGWAILEGVAWGIACTIKPFAIFAALACWFVSLIVTYQRTSKQRIFGDLIGLLAGGAILGCASSYWLVSSGNWDRFVKDAFSEWNQDYYDSAPSLWWRLGHILSWFWPWSLIHLLAMPTAFGWLRQIRKSVLGSDVYRGLLSAMYLAWFFQATFIQKQFVYQVTPTILLGLAVVAAARNEWPWCVRLGRRPWAIGQAMGAIFLIWAVVVHPIWRLDRLAIWSRCWTEGSTAQIRDGLALETDKAATSWTDLARVRSFLETQNLQAGELTCLSPSTMPLYWDMDMPPSTRFLFLDTDMRMFRHHIEQIQLEVTNSMQRLVVTDLRQLGLTFEEATAKVPGRPLSLPLLPEGRMRGFLYDLPVIYRSGRYLVHQCPPPELRRFLSSHGGSQ
jgi:hypothetical protein